MSFSNENEYILTTPYPVTIMVDNKEVLCKEPYFLGKFIEYLGRPISPYDFDETAIAVFENGSVYRNGKDILYDQTDYHKGIILFSK